MAQGGPGWDNSVCALCGGDVKMPWIDLKRKRDELTNQHRNKDRMLAELVCNMCAYHSLADSHQRPHVVFYFTKNLHACVDLFSCYSDVILFIASKQLAQVKTNRLDECFFT